jgi:AcrR family transcriptional regulator
MDVRDNTARRRLVEAALAEFAEKGFDGASTRGIAARAGANIAAIPYYFGGKQGLYLAVAEHIADRIGSLLGPLLAVPASPPPSAAEARERLMRIADGFAATLLAAEEAALWARFVVREQFDPTEAFDILYARWMGPTYAAIGDLLAGATGLPAESDEVKLRVFALIGQALVFRIGRAAIGRRMGWDGYTPERLDQIRAVLRQHLAAILDGAGR